MLGGYDEKYIAPGNDLTLLKTFSLGENTAWFLKSNNFKIGDKDLLPGETRYSIIEPSSPFIYMPETDF